MFCDANHRSDNLKQSSVRDFEVNLKIFVSEPCFAMKITVRKILINQWFVILSQNKYFRLRTVFCFAYHRSENLDKSSIREIFVAVFRSIKKFFCCNQLISSFFSTNLDWNLSRNTEACFSLTKKERRRLIQSLCLFVYLFVCLFVCLSF